MATMKTKKTAASVDEFLAAIPSETTRADAAKLGAMMKRASKSEPKMWGGSIVGFGSRLLTYSNGRTLDWFAIGFSPRKQAMTLYLGDFRGRDEWLSKLGTHTTGKGCIYIKALADVDAAVLQKLLDAAVAR